MAEHLGEREVRLRDRDVAPQLLCDLVRGARLGGDQAANLLGAPPVQADLLGLVVTTSDVNAELWARTGDGLVLGNLLYNVANLLNQGNTASLLLLLTQLAQL